MIVDDAALSRHWRDSRLPAQGLHLDSAACSRQSLAALRAADWHACRESEIGGYVASAAAEPTLESGRTAVAALTGMSSVDVAFTTGSLAALDILLRAWPGERTLACGPGEYGPNLAAFAEHGFRPRILPADSLGRIDPDSAARALRANPPAMVHVTGLGSHRGVAQPLEDIAAICRQLEVPFVVDAAQSLGHIDCAVDADVVYASSRKWLAGPRGVGVLAIAPRLAEKLKRPDWADCIPLAAWIEAGEANIAARVGFSVAASDFLSLGAESIRRRLRMVGAASRSALAGVPGWRVVEPAGEPTAITTLEPIGDADPVTTRARLIAEYDIVTTAAGIQRAPLELRRPVLRLSPHIDCSAEDLHSFAGVLEGLGT